MKFMQEGEEDINTYLGSILNIVPEDKQKECLESCQRAYSDYTKILKVKKKDELDDTIKYIELNNKHMTPDIRHNKYMDVIKLMNLLEMDTSKNLKRLLAQKNLKINSIRNKNTNPPITFMFNELEYIVSKYKAFYDLDEAANIKKKRNEKNRKKKERKRRIKNRD